MRYLLQTLRGRVQAVAPVLLTTATLRLFTTITYAPQRIPSLATLSALFCSSIPILMDRNSGPATRRFSYQPYTWYLRLTSIRTSPTQDAFRRLRNIPTFRAIVIGQHLPPHHLLARSKSYRHGTNRIGSLSPSHFLLSKAFILVPFKVLSIIDHATSIE